MAICRLASSCRVLHNRRRAKKGKVVVGAMKTASRDDEHTWRDAVHQKLTKYLSESLNFVKKMPSQVSFEVLGNKMNHFQRLNEVKELKIFFFAQCANTRKQASIEQATVAMRCLGANSPESRRRVAPIGHVSAAHSRHVSDVTNGTLNKAVTSMSESGFHYFGEKKSAWFRAGMGGVSTKR